MTAESLRLIAELPGLDPVLKTAHKTMRCSSLRPGHWLVPHAERGRVAAVACVLQSSKEFRRVEVYYPAFNLSEPLTWVELEGSLVYGQGIRRWWHPLLPKFLQTQICPFTKPRK